MNKEENGKQAGRYALKSAKESAYIAVFVALLIAVQLAFSAIPVEFVTVFFIAYASVFRWKRAMAVGTVFSLVRQLLFGFFPTVLVLYLLYFNAVALVFGKWQKPCNKAKNLVFTVLLSCVCTVGFTLLDNVLTPLWYGYAWAATKAYFKASLFFLIPQTIGTGVSVALLFLPLTRVFALIGKGIIAQTPQK